MIDCPDFIPFFGAYICAWGRDITAYAQSKYLTAARYSLWGFLEVFQGISILSMISPTYMGRTFCQNKPSNQFQKKGPGNSKRAGPMITH